MNHAAHRRHGSLAAVPLLYPKAARRKSQIEALPGASTNRYEEEAQKFCQRGEVRTFGLHRNSVTAVKH